MQGLTHDARFAVRLLLKERWFTLAAVVALALGMAVATMMVTILNGYYWRGMPVSDPDRIVALGTRDASGGEHGVSYADYRDWQRAARSFTALGAYSGAAMTVSDEGQSPDSVGGAYLSAEAFNILPDRPVLGRHLLAADDRPGAPPVVLIGYDLWTTRYNRDVSLVGRSIGVNGATAMVIGVMPAGFEFPFRHALWLPLTSMPGLASQPRDTRTLGVFGLLAPEVNRIQARAELDAIAASLSAAFPTTNTGVTTTAVRFGEQQVGRFADAQPPQALAIAAMVILLIACANVANLLLARAAGRRREISIRASVGATRWRIVRQLLVESVMLASGAGLLGLWLSTFGVRFVAGAFGRNVPYWMRLTIDGRVLAALVAICFLTSIAFGLAPALFASKSDGGPVADDGGRSSAPPRLRRWTDALMVAEIVMTLVLLAAGGLTVRSYLVLYRVDRIVDVSRMLTAELALPASYATPQARTAFYERLDERLATLPGGSLAVVASARPFVGASSRQLSLTEGQVAAGNAPPSVGMVAISPRYFATMGMALLRGRPFGTADGTPGAETAIVNQRFVDVHFGGRDPIGQRLRLTEKGNEPAAAPWLTIVGVAPTVRQGIASGPRPIVYVPLRLHASTSAALIITSPSNTAAVVPALRREIASLDPEITLSNVRSLRALRDDSRLQHRVVGTVLAVFAAIALLLSLIGLYAVTAYTVMQRRHEIGVRMALGARAWQVVWLFVRRGMTVLSIGVLLGLIGAIAVGQVLRGGLVQTSPTDPLTLVAIACLLVVTAVAACFFPARGAARVDPLVVLRRD